MDNMNKCIKRIKDDKKKYVDDNIFLMLSALMWTLSTIATIITYVFDNSVPEPIVRAFIVSGSFTFATVVLPLAVMCYLERINNE